MFDKAQKKAKKAAKKLKNLKAALLARGKTDVVNVSKSPKISTPKRSAKLKAATLTGYKGVDKSAGLCTSGNCCLTSFTDATCKMKLQKMCKQAKKGKKNTKHAKFLPAWKRLLPIHTVFRRKAKTTGVSTSYNRTMTVEAQWAPLAKNQGQVLQVRVCGRFTKYGRTGARVCYPRKNAGMRLSEVFAAESGKCVRTADFIRVLKPRLQKKVYNLMKSMKSKKKLAKAKLKDASKARKLDELTAVQRSVSKLYGQKKKKKLESDEVVAWETDSFLDEGVQELAKHFLGKKGSFMITTVPSKNSKKNKKGKKTTSVKSSPKVKSKKGFKRKVIPSGGGKHSSKLKGGNEVMELEN